MMNPWRHAAVFATLLLWSGTASAQVPPVDEGTDEGVGVEATGGEETTGWSDSEDGTTDESYEETPLPDIQEPDVLEEQYADPPAVIDTEEEADAPPPLTVKASLFTRYELRSGYDNIGRANSDFVRYRARFGLVTAPANIGDDLTAVVRFVPQASGFWNVGGDTLEDASLNLHEGVLELRAGSTRVEAGRFEMVYGDHVVIGNVGWHHTARTFDGLRLRLPMGADNSWLDAFITMVDEGLVDGIVNPFGGGDTYFAGLYGAFGPMLSPGMDLDGYVLAQMAPKTDDPTTMTTIDAMNRITIGARTKNRAGMLDYRLEAGVQIGSVNSDTSIFAFQGDVEVGVRLLEDNLRISVEGLYASGDDPTTTDTSEGWSHLYPTAHKFLGLTDIMGARTNVISGVLHVAYTVAPGTAIRLDGHYFMRPQDVGGVDPVTMMPFTIESGPAGAEVDLGASHALGSGLSTRVGYSIFLPQEDMFGSTDPAHFFELELKYTQ